MAIITQYPDSSRAADAYEALRKGIMNGASASTIHQQNLVSLANAIDEGATPETLRRQLGDLLSTLNVREIRFEEAQAAVGQNLDQVFVEVGETAHERSAWMRINDGKTDILQKGYIRKYPQVTRSTDSRVDEDFNQEDDASIAVTDTGVLEHDLEQEVITASDTHKERGEGNES